MTRKNTYSKKISSEEEREGYILVLKDKLPTFPPRPQKFNLVSERDVSRVSVESYSCQCRGPELPHEHYFVRWAGLKQGQKVVITRNPAENSDFRLTIET